MPKRPRPNWKVLREALWFRCGGVCEVSGRPLDPDTFDAHHRRNKGMGGTYRSDTDTLPNLLALDPVVHNGGPGSVHADRHSVSGPRGWLVSKLSTTPLDLTPVLIARSPLIRQWVLLVDEIRVPIGPPIAVGGVPWRRSLDGVVRVDWTPEEENVVHDPEQLRAEYAAVGRYVMPKPLPTLVPYGRMAGKSWTPEPERPDGQ
jgi:hypothetical protein